MQQKALIFLRNPRNPHGPMLEHLLRSYCQWWNLSFRVQDHDSLNWCLQGPQNSLVIPYNPSMLVPSWLQFLKVGINGQQIELPFPCSESCPDSPACPEVDFSVGFQEDLLLFLAGQLWRAEELEPEHYENAHKALSKDFLGDRYPFFDRPIVDLWIRAILEYLQGSSLEPPKAWRDTSGIFPRFWLSCEIRSLRKWTLPDVLKHVLFFPSYAVTSQMRKWFKLMVQALQSHFPQKDPWFTLPEIAQTFQNQSLTLFWKKESQSDHKVLAQHLADSHRIRLQFGLLQSEDLQSFDACFQQGVSHEHLVHRSENLVFKPLQTLCDLEAQSVDMDSSYGWYDRPGFRCGSCIPISWWDLEKQTPLSMIEMPPIALDWLLFQSSSFSDFFKAIATQVELAGGILALVSQNQHFSREDFPGYLPFQQALLQELESNHWKSWLYSAKSNDDNA